MQIKRRMHLTWACDHKLYEKPSLCWFTSLGEDHRGKPHAGWDLGMQGEWLLQVS